MEAVAVTSVAAALKNTLSVVPLQKQPVILPLLVDLQGGQEAAIIQSLVDSCSAPSPQVKVEH